MATKNQEERQLTAVITSVNGQESGFTGAQIALAYKAALSDFVLGKTTRNSVAEVSKLLAGSLAARKQEIAEKEESSSHRVHKFY